MNISPAVKMDAYHRVKAFEQRLAYIDNKHYIWFHKQGNLETIFNYLDMHITKSYHLKVNFLTIDHLPDNIRKELFTAIRESFLNAA